MLPPIEDTFVNYLSVGDTLMLMTLTLPSKPLKMTSMLNGRLCTQLQCCRHKDLDDSQVLSPEAVTELC